MNFQLLPCWGIHHQMVHSDRKAEDQEQYEGQPSHRVAIEAAAGRPRHDRVERDVGRDEPEIDDGMQRPRKQRACEPRIDGLHEAEGRGNHLEQKLGRNADGGPKPHHGVRHCGEHRQRHRPAGILALPAAHRDEHEQAPDPRPHHDEHEPDIEEGARRERRIECKEDRRSAQNDGDQHHHDANDRHPEGGPRPGFAGERAVERRHRDEIAEAHDEERGQHVGHRNAVRRDRHEVLPWRTDVGAQWTANPHLPGAENCGDEKRRERHPEMRKAKAFNVAHRKPSRPGRA